MKDTAGLQQRQAADAGAHMKGWEDHHGPGWPQIDKLAHFGARIQGPLLRILMATDIATGWNESVPIPLKYGAVMFTALQLIRRQLPFQLRGINADNHHLITNSLLAAW